MKEQPVGAGKLWTTTAGASGSRSQQRAHNVIRRMKCLQGDSPGPNCLLKNRLAVVFKFHSAKHLAVPPVYDMRVMLCGSTAGQLKMEVIFFNWCLDREFMMIAVDDFGSLSVSSASCSLLLQVLDSGPWWKKRQSTTTIVTGLEGQRGAASALVSGDTALHCTVGHTEPLPNEGLCAPTNPPKKTLRAPPVATRPAHTISCRRLGAAYIAARCTSPCNSSRRLSACLMRLSLSLAH